MKKRLVAIVLALVIILTASIAFAAPTQQQLLAAQKIVDATNFKIELIIKVAQLTPWDDSAAAVAATDRLADITIDFLADQYGVVAVCEYESVVIDGNVVLIDPIKIIEF